MSINARWRELMMWPGLLRKAFKFRTIYRSKHAFY